jgi:hypothetical protein
MNEIDSQVLTVRRLLRRDYMEGNSRHRSLRPTTNALCTNPSRFPVSTITCHPSNIILPPTDSSNRRAKLIPRLFAILLQR